MNTIYVAYTDSIPLAFFWTDNASGANVKIPLEGTNGQVLDIADDQLCYFTIIDEATGLPLSSYFTAKYLHLDAANDMAVYTIQQGEGPDVNGCLPIGSYTVVGELDSLATVNAQVTPYKKKAYVQIVVQKKAFDYST